MQTVKIFIVSPLLTHYSHFKPGEKQALIYPRIYIYIIFYLFFFRGSCLLFDTEEQALWGGDHVALRTIWVVPWAALSYADAQM